MTLFSNKKTKRKERTDCWWWQSRRCWWWWQERERGWDEPQWARRLIQCCWSLVVARRKCVCKDEPQGLPSSDFGGGGKEKERGRAAMARTSSDVAGGSGGKESMRKKRTSSNGSSPPPTVARRKSEDKDEPQWAHPLNRCRCSSSQPGGGKARETKRTSLIRCRREREMKRTDPTEVLQLILTY